MVLECNSEGFPNIFLPERPKVVIAYFGGPWLPMSYVGEFLEYNYSLKRPLDILEIPERRKVIVDALVSILDSPQETKQRVLFSQENKKREGLEEIFDELVFRGKSLYGRFRKKVGNKVRDLVVVNKSLRPFLEEYLKPILMQAPCHHKCHGGEKGWSVKKSLGTHLPMGTVLSFDLANAFQNVDMQYVFDFYYQFLMERIEDNKTKRDLAGFLTMVSTVYYDNIDNYALPVGSPVSMALFNRVMHPIDKLFHKSSQNRGLRYSRWVDDMVISSPKRNVKREKLLGALNIVRGDFPIALEKVFLQQHTSEFYLLGHKVNDDLIVKVTKEEMQKKGDPVNPEYYMTNHEVANMVDDWTSDHCDKSEGSIDNFF